MYVAYSEKIIVSNGLDILTTTALRAYQHTKVSACYIVFRTINQPTKQEFTRINACVASYRQ